MHPILERSLSGFEATDRIYWTFVQEVSQRLDLKKQSKSPRLTNDPYQYRKTS
jgi:hypothetical protein